MNERLKFLACHIRAIFAKLPAGGDSRNAMLKRTADWMEKFSVGSFLVGVYQSSTSDKGLFALVLGIAAYIVSLYLTKGGAK